MTVSTSAVARTDAREATSKRSAAPRAYVSLLLALAVSVLTFVMAPAVAGAANPADPDPAFGPGGDDGDGWFTNGFGSPEDAAVLANGDIVTVGAYQSNVIVIRHSGTDGSVLNSEQLPGASNPSLGVQRDGKLLVAVQKTSTSWSITRYTGALLVDTTFGTNGTVDVSFPMEMRLLEVYERPVDNRVFAVGHGAGTNARTIGEVRREPGGAQSTEGSSFVTFPGRG